MTVINMKEFGTVLTGREYGVNAAEKIFHHAKPPFTFNFQGVLTLGSSFGDEIIKAAKKITDTRIKVANANKVVRGALNQIQSDLKIELEYE